MNIAKISRNFQNSLVTFSRMASTRCNVAIIGGGHNGLIAAAYLAKNGKSVQLYERRHILGGAAVTEEIIPGFKFSRASYVLGLLRPHIIDDLDLCRHGLKVTARNPNSYTPLHEDFWDRDKKSLILGASAEKDRKEIAKFSVNDSKNIQHYEAYLRKFVDMVTPLLDLPPVDINELKGKNFLDQLNYVLLHHLMGEVNGVKEAWGFPIGGMGSVTQSIASSAREAGAELFTDKPVNQIATENDKAVGLHLENGDFVEADTILSNATSKVTFLDLLPTGVLPTQFEKEIKSFDYTSPVCKINVALKNLPNFKANPNSSRNEAMPHHQSTIHLNCESTRYIHDAYVEGSQGRIPHRPMIEMTIPSSVDKTLAPEGCHVALFFTQYVSYTLEGNKPWDNEAKTAYAKKIFSTVEQYAPGFMESIVDYEVLPPPELEKIFGLTGGNIFHGAMSLDQLYFCRPTSFKPSPFTPVKGLLMCGSGAHPGGGVMGAAGKIAANAILNS